MLCLVLQLDHVGLRLFVFSIDRLIASIFDLRFWHRRRSWRWRWLEPWSIWVFHHLFRFHPMPAWFLVKDLQFWHLVVSVQGLSFSFIHSIWWVSWTCFSGHPNDFVFFRSFLPSFTQDFVSCCLAYIWNFIELFVSILHFCTYLLCFRWLAIFKVADAAFSEFISHF